MIDENKMREYIKKGARLVLTMEDGTFITGYPKRVLCMTFIDMGEGVRVDEVKIERMEEA
jgi:hypothetical protein